MSVILLILKIIGIALLVILGVFLLLVLVLCFYPLGYRIRGQIEEEIQIRFNLHWLFYLVYLNFEMKNSEKYATLYVFGIPIRLYPPKEKKVKTRRRKKAAAEKLKPEADDEEIAEAPALQATSISIDDDMKEEPVHKERVSMSGTAEKASSRLGALIEKIKGIFQRIRRFFTTLPGKLKMWCDKVSDWRGTLTNESNQASVKLILREIKYLLLHYRPRKLKADIRYGFSDPSMTGKSLAVISMIPLFYKKGVQIVPDFEAEQSFVKGNIDAKGSILLFHLLRLGLHIWKDENSKNFIRQLR